MSLNERQIGFTHPFGPVIVQSTISDEIHSILLTRATQLRNGTHENKEINTKTNDFRNQLAGNLSETYSYSGALTKGEEKIVMNELLWLASSFTNLASQAGTLVKNEILEPEDIFIKGQLWVNFMKAGEWQPCHNHEGDISIVTYLEIPPEIAEENKTGEHTKHSNSPTAGCIEFQFGNIGNMRYTTDRFIQTPKEKEIYVFPGQLNHQVYPFKSKVERISVSCNFLNRSKVIENFAQHQIDVGEAVATGAKTIASARKIFS